MPWGFARPTLDAIMGMFKTTTPPDWYANSQELRALLSGKWADVSKEFLQNLNDALKARDLGQLDSLVATVASLGPRMSAAISDETDAILATLQQKATAAWTLHGKQTLGVNDLRGFSGDYEKFLVQSHAEQIKRFTELNPGRILHPELVRQVDYLRNGDLIRSVDIDLISRQLERVVKQQPYWEGLSDVHVARLWHADGLYLAQENGVIECYVTGPDDKKTCPVCQRMLGTRVVVKDAVKKIESDIAITDPDDYVRAWRFPRIQDVDNISPKERTAKGYLAPFHSRCRHGNAWLRYGASPSIKPLTKPADRPGWKLRKNYVDINYPERFSSMAEAARWVRLHVADRLLVDKDVSLEFVNAALGHLRLVSQAAPLRKPLNSLQITAIEGKANGRFIAHSTGKSEIKINKARDYEYYSVAERRAKEIDSLKLQTESLVNVKKGRPDLSEHIDTRLTQNEARIKTLQSSAGRPDIDYSVSSSIADSPAGGTMIHEYSHAWHYQHDDKVRKQFGIRYFKDRGSALEQELAARYRVSKYSATNWEETFAENFTLYMHGEVKRMHVDMVKFFDSQFTKLQFGKRLTPEIYEVA